jgi:NAD(P)H-dependent FMN reductase
MKPLLHIIICSTRPGRSGPAVATWFHELAQLHGEFDAQLIDLAGFDLPVFDEPNHPRLQRYVNSHTKSWSASVSSAEAFVFVLPEYNHGPPPSFLNALTYLSREWNYKPAAFVSYGGTSGGTRAVVVAQLALVTLRVVPIFETVAIAHFQRHITEGTYVPSEFQVDAAHRLLRELKRWVDPLNALRASRLAEIGADSEAAARVLKQAPARTS